MSLQLKIRVSIEYYPILGIISPSLILRPLRRLVHSRKRFRYRLGSGQDLIPPAEGGYRLPTFYVAAKHTV